MERWSAIKAWGRERYKAINWWDLGLYVIVVASLIYAVSLDQRIGKLERGPQGETGVPGDTGDTGDRGRQGIVTEGRVDQIARETVERFFADRNLTDGIDGSLGPIGPVGPAGPRGPRGRRGPEGPQGKIGVPGVDGAPGVPGETPSVEDIRREVDELEGIVGRICALPIVPTC